MNKRQLATVITEELKHIREAYRGKSWGTSWTLSTSGLGSAQYAATNNSGMTRLFQTKDAADTFAKTTKGNTNSRKNKPTAAVKESLPGDQASRDYLTKLSLAALRKRQDLTKAQITKAYAAKNTKALERLQDMDRDLAAAVAKKSFKDETFAAANAAHDSNLAKKVTIERLKFDKDGNYIPGPSCSCGHPEDQHTGGSMGCVGKRPGKSHCGCKKFKASTVKESSSSPIEVVLTKSHRDEGGPTEYAVLAQGMPVMANTKELKSAIIMLKRTIEHFKKNRTPISVSLWDGDKGKQTPINIDQIDNLSVLPSLKEAQEVTKILLTKAKHFDKGPIMYAVLVSGSPVMASTKDYKTALRVLEKTLVHFNSTHVPVEVGLWDGDKGKESKLNVDKLPTSLKEAKKNRCRMCNGKLDDTETAGSGICNNCRYHFEKNESVMNEAFPDEHIDRFLQQNFELEKGKDYVLGNGMIQLKGLPNDKDIRALTLGSIAAEMKSKNLPCHVELSSNRILYQLPSQPMHEDMDSFTSQFHYKKYFALLDKIAKTIGDEPRKMARAFQKQTGLGDQMVTAAMGAWAANKNDAAIREMTGTSAAPCPATKFAFGNPEKMKKIAQDHGKYTIVKNDPADRSSTEMVREAVRQIVRDLTE